jgi:hypothetical protein
VADTSLYPADNRFPVTNRYPGSALIKPGKYAPIVPRLSGGDRTHVIYRGPDRSRFFLAGMKGQGKQGVEWARGVVGLDRPPAELVWLQEARQNGADLVGTNVDVRTIRFAVNILGGNTREWRDHFAAWNRANQHQALGRLFFINSYSGVRFCDVLLGEAPNGSMDTDPALLRRLVDYPMSWVAPNPYYKGYTETFDAVVPQPDNRGLAEMMVKVRNLGSSYTYPKIRLEGPGTWSIPAGSRRANELGVEGQGEFDDMVIDLPTIKANEYVWLDTDPRVETIDLFTPDGSKRNLWAQMSGQRPRLKLLADRTEDFYLSVKGGLPGRKAKIVVQPLYTSFT